MKIKWRKYDEYSQQCSYGTHHFAVSKEDYHLFTVWLSAGKVEPPRGLAWHECNEVFETKKAAKKFVEKTIKGLQ